MQFVRNGPDLPERLLQAHEDGRVVFFCGAGISMPALPNFAGLVKKLYAKLEPMPNPGQERAIEGRQYDIAVDLLDAEITGGRAAVRQELASILKIPPEFNKSTAHESLLELGKNRGDGNMQLVTTNFDRLFEKVLANKSPQVERFEAPNLPIRKKQWDGLVYLHGLLPEEPTPSSKLDHLVVSSSDFGRAYFTERWASRFISELFRNHIVCFVGYSLDDPMLRYISGAIATEREQGVPTQEMFAFGFYSKNEENEQRKEWESRNVTPILYLKNNQHAHLLKTLQAWSETYRDGVVGKENIVAEYATKHPSESTKEDDFVSRIIWALSDPSGLPAKRFAELDPVPSLDWLNPLRKELYNRTDSDRFGTPTKAGFGSEGALEQAHKLPSHDSVRLMTFFAIDVVDGKWNEVMWRLASWLTRHLNDPALLLWTGNHGDSLHHNLVNLIESRLDKLSKFERDNDTSELERIRSNASSAIPTASMRTLWRLLLTGRVSGSSRARHTALHFWKARFKRDGLTTTLRLELRECLAPRVSLHKPIKLRAKVGGDSEPERIEDLVGWKVVLFADNVLHDLEELAKDKRWIAALPELLTEFSSLLRDALDLMYELGSASDLIDPSCVLRPSISEHTQNRNVYDWTTLIDLTRNAWLSTAEQSPEQARWVAEGWLREPYPLFRRLAFFAAAQGKVIPSRQGLDWLLADKYYWLWSAQTRRETMRLLATLAPRLTKTEMAELEKAILNGPPPARLENHIDHERKADIVDSDIWLRLTKIDQADATLSEDGRKKLTELRARHPGWKLDENERDELSSWISFSWGDKGNLVATPRRRRELIKWLKLHPSSHWRTNGQRTNDDWQERCRNNFPTAACALCALAKEGDWPADRWSAALQEWSKEKLTKRSWSYMAPVLANATDEQLQPFALELSRWLKAIAETFVGQDEIFLALCKRVLKLKHKDGTNRSNDSVTDALIHPVGSVTEALLSWWYREEPKDGQGLPNKLETTFTMLCDTNLDKFRHGRVSLAENLMLLFRVDRGWTTKHLLPSFDWQISESEACAVWQSFLMSLRFDRPLLEVLKADFLETANHYESLARYGEEYALLLTFAALDRGDTFETKELAVATRALPPDGLHYAAQELVRTIEGAGKRRANCWTNRVAPYLREIWPKTRDKVYPAVTTDLGRVCIAAQEAFPEAFDLLKHWLQPTTDSSRHHGHIRLVRQLHKTKVCSQFPEQALDFLGLVIPKQRCWIPEELGACLKAIQTSKPELEKDAKYQQLMERVRQQEVD